VGGRHLANLLTHPCQRPIGEAWLLSDRDDIRVALPMDRSRGGPSVNCYGSFRSKYWEAGWTLRRFPLLLKFLDVHEMLSVQVHPTKRTRTCCQQERPRRPKRGSFCEAGTQSRIYAGSSQRQRKPICAGTYKWDGGGPTREFTPKPGDAVFLRAGTVHSLGGDLGCSRSSRIAT